MNPLEVLLAECGPFSEPSTFSATGVHHGYRQYTLKQDHPFVDWCETGWVSWILPGGFIIPHIDAGPWRTRFQLPIRPGPIWYEDGVRSAVSGVPFRVDHWRQHAVWNDTDRPRVHVVWEEDAPTGGEAPFETFPYDHIPELVRLVGESF